MDWAKTVACLEEILSTELAAEGQEKTMVETALGTSRVKKAAPGAVNTKKVTLDEPGSKTTTIGADLDPK